MAGGSVTKRTWSTRKGEKSAWRVGYYDQNGKRQRRTFPTKAAAEDWLTDTRTEIKAGIHTPDAGSITVKEAAEIWLAQCKSDGLERGTLRVYDQYARLYIVKLIGAKKLSRLTTPNVVAFRNVVLEQTSRQRARKVLSALKPMLEEMRRLDGRMSGHAPETGRRAGGNRRVELRQATSKRCCNAPAVANGSGS